eukprot:14086778-Alexandrium_andersonii.AAC.1
MYMFSPSAPRRLKVLASERPEWAALLPESRCPRSHLSLPARWAAQKRGIHPPPHSLHHSYM